MVEVVFQRDALVRALSVVKPLCNGKSIAILGAVRLVVNAEKGTAELTANDTSIAVTQILDVTSTGDLSVCLNRRVFEAAVRNMGKRVTLSFSQFGTFETISERLTAQQAGTITFSGDGLAVTINNWYILEDFPALPVCRAPLASKHKREIDVSAFQRIYKNTRHCVSDEETRYYLQGVYFDKTDTGSLRAVSTNGHVLAQCDTPDVLGFDKGFIMPVELADLLHKLAPAGTNEPMSIEQAVGPHDVVFLRVTIGSTVAYSKTIDGTYPDYRRVTSGVIGDHPPAYTATFAHLGLKRLGGVANAVTRFKSNTVVIDFEKQQARCVVEPTFEAHNKDFVTSGGAVLQISAQALIENHLPKDQPVGFDLKYLRAQGEVTPEFVVSAAMAGVAAQIRSDDPHARWIIMPRRV